MRFLDFKKEGVCKVKEIVTKNCNWSKKLRLQVSRLFLLTSQGDIFSNKAKLLKFIFRNFPQFPKLNDSLPFAEMNLSNLSHFLHEFLLATVTVLSRKHSAGKLYVPFLRFKLPGRWTPHKNLLMCHISAAH